MTESTDAVMEQLRATLWRRVGAATRANLTDLAAVLVGLAEDPEDDGLRERAVRLAHAVAGTAGVYGFRDEARDASVLEGLFRAWPGADGLEPARVLLSRLDDGFEVQA